METKTKTHYRKVFKSDHLGLADLEEMIEAGQSLIFIIKEVKQEYDVKVAGRKGNHNIAYFVEPIKPLVLNATNSKRVRAFNGGSVWVEDWCDTMIELYPDYDVKMKGEKVGGVRIKTKQPILNKPKPPIGDKRFVIALEKIKEGTLTVEQLEDSVLLTQEQKDLINE